MRLLDLGKDVFESAIVDSSVLLLREGVGGGAFPAVDMDTISTPDFPPHEALWGRVRTDGSRPWSILSPLEESVMDKMLSVGTPLGEWANKINRGILSGYNTAFLIDDGTRETLISQDPKSAEVIKPILRGKDIRRYKAEWADLWLITTHNGYGDISAIDVEDYPAVKNYLDRYYLHLEKRQDKGQTPYNLRNCTYYKDFAKEKLFWMDMSPRARVAYSDAEEYCNDKAFILTGASLKYLCAVLNSSLITWFMRHTALTTGMGLIQWKRFAVERIPVPRLPAAKHRPLVRVVDHILDANNADPSADTGEMEREIDWLVYELYGLSEEEIGAVEVRA